MVKLLLRAFSVALLLSTTGSVAGTISQDPLFLVTQAPPRVLFSMSNDHQLFVKAYTDYTDLDGDGQIDTTYLDSFDYYGYFDNAKCYKYDSSDDRFEPDGSASGTNGHECAANNQWSGNWLNWATMTRMDILRKVLYGGKRSVDTTSDTELERALLPNDVHAFAKVYDAGSTSTMDKFTPYNNKTVITVCNVTFDNDGSESYSGKISTSSSPPIMQVVEGSYPQWAASEVHQCSYGSGTRPASSERLESPDLEVRVQVCVSGSEEPNCKTYGSDTKPAGILQNYGENTATTQMNFGLMTGSYQKNKSGGVLRKNIVPFVGNGNTDDEVDTSTGIFKYFTDSSYEKGIIHTLDSIRIAGWDYSGHKHRNSCDSPGKLTFNNGECVDWGNPLGEIYLEGLRYLAGKTSATTAFDATDTSYIPDLTKASWVDPIPSTEWCADMSVIALSTGLNSFDTDELSHDITGLDVSAETTEVGTQEGVSGNYHIGEVPSDDDNQCTAKSLSDLDDAKGICPEVPSLEGGYQIAGMAYYAHTNDIRSDRTDDQTVTTYGIALAESLPRFEIPVGSGSVTILPGCEARNNNSTPWRVCSMTDLTVLSLNSDGTAGDFDVSWEDSTWGNDYDMDGIANIAFCVGSECSPAINSDEIEITTTLRQVNAGHQLRFGFLVGGTSADDVYLDVVKQSNFNYTTSPPSPSDHVKTRTLTQGSSTSNILDNPLFYAAKYGAFEEKDDSSDPKPNLQSEWDEDNDGLPDGYFKATDPSELFVALSEVVGDIVSRTSSASAVATNSTRLDTNSRIYQARFVSGAWYGQLLAYDINDTTGAVESAIWDSSELIPAENSRNIFSYNDQSNAGVVFEYANLHSSQQAYLTSAQLDYVRGDQSNEGTTYRTRPTVLGDIINSDPLFTSMDNFDYYTLELSGGFATYDDYLVGTTETWEKGNRPDVLYVGANDGMLHAFLGEGDITSGCNVASEDCEGEELFAYIPKAVIPNLASLSDLSYNHKYFVDGSAKHGDAYIDFDGDGDRWGTALVGTLAGGGKGIFALDISDPLNFDEDDVLWDLDDSDLSELGYTFSQPSIVKLATGDWGVIFGNGYGSANGEAVLYILNLETGAVIEPITLEDSSGINGLSTPIAVDTDGDKVADTVYAGDLLGNMWAVDISGNSNQWGSKYKQGSNPIPLFRACTDDPCTDPQPITSKPQVVSADPSGVIVLFGTGKYFETGDNTDTSQIQTYYGVNDSGTDIDGRNDLVEQDILAELTAAQTGLNYDIRVTTDYGVDFTAKKGWFMDFDSSSYLGERIVANSLVRNGRVIFPTLVPDTVACSFGGTSWLMELDAQTGSRLTISPFDLNDDGAINSGDYVRYDSDGDGDIDSDDDLVPVSGKKSTVGIIKTPGVISTGDDELKYTSGSSGNIEVTTESSGDLLGRQSWIQIK